MIVQQLAAPVALPRCIAIVGAVERGEVVSPVDVILLHGIGQTLGVEDELIQLEAVGVNIVRLGRIAVAGGAEVQRWIEPSVELGAAAGLVDGGHQRIAVAVGLADDGRAAV